MHAQGVEFDVVSYLDNPLTRGVLEQLVNGLAKDPMSLLRTKDAKYKATGLDPEKTLTASQVVEVLVKHPEVMERPVAVKGKNVIIARPPEKILELL